MSKNKGKDIRSATGKRASDELIENESILNMEGPASVVSMSECTGLLAALPNDQADAAALNEIVHTNTVLIPPVSDKHLNTEGKKRSPDKR